MALRTGLLLALLSLAPALAAAAPAFPALSPDVRVDITADRLTSDEAGRAEAEGRVRMTAGPIRVAAEHAVYDPDTSLLVADGNVTLVSGAIAVRAERVSIDLAAQQGVLEGAAMFEKTQPLAIEDAAAADLEALRAIGRNTLQVEAGRLVIEPEGSLVAYDPTVTTCDCGDSPPSWTVGASKAVIIPGVSLRLHWPVLKARGVPVGVFPYVSLPLQPRKTGFLPPRISPAGRLGFSWEQDFFLVLGESYDATLGLDYFTGKQEDTYLTYRGPRARTEFRYAPRVGTEGRAFVAYAHDLSAGTKPKHGPERALNADRWNVALDHTDDWGLGFSDRVALGLVSDRLYLNDFTDSVILRGEKTVRSTAWFAHRAGESLLVADAAYVQDLRGRFEPDYTLPPGASSWGSARLFGERARRPFQRFPGLALDLVHVPVGPVQADLRLGASRHDPVVGAPFDDVGPDGLGSGDFYYPGPDAGENDGKFQAGETSATTRLSARTGVSLPVVLDPYLSVVPFVGYRQLFYANDVGRDDEQGWGLFGASARTELARSFGPRRARIRHAIGPRIEVRRLVPVTEPRIGPFDELDVGPWRPETQGRVALWQRLAGKTRLGRTALELSLGEDFLLAPGAERAEDFLDADATVGPARASLRLRLDPEAFSLREVAFRSGVDFRIVALALDYAQIAEGASARLLAGPDELFGTRPRFRREAMSSSADLRGVDPALGEVQVLSPGITVRPVEGLAVSFTSSYLWPVDDWLQQVLGVFYESTCNCWSVGFQLAYRYNTYAPDHFPEFGSRPSFENFSINLSGMGSL